MSVQEVVFFVVDLFETEGRGEFKCPRCGVEISQMTLQRMYTKSWM